MLPPLMLFLDNVCTVPHVVSLLGLSSSPASGAATPLTVLRCLAGSSTPLTP